VKGPKLFCGPIDKTLIRSDPPAAGAPPGSATGSFLCYAARCPDAPGSFEASDQFGTYTLRRRKSVLLCAPARTPTTTTTTGPSTTTSTTLPICGVPAEPACNGTCPPGQECVVLSFGPGLTGCGCAAVPGCRNTGGGVCGGNCPPGCLTACVSPECFCICA
jgi:hypothetical protein